MKCSWASLNLQAGSRRFPALTRAVRKPRASHARGCFRHSPPYSTTPKRTSNGDDTASRQAPRRRRSGPTGPVSFADSRPRDMVEEAQHAAPVIGMAGELAKLVAILTVKPDGISPSVILVAPTGSGDVTVCRLAQEVFRARRGERDPLPVRELFELELSVLLAGTSYRGQLEQRDRHAAGLHGEGGTVSVHRRDTHDGPNGQQWRRVAVARDDQTAHAERASPHWGDHACETRLPGTDPALTRRFFRFDVDPFTHAETVEILDMICR